MPQNQFGKLRYIIYYSFIIIEGYLFLIYKFTKKLLQYNHKIISKIEEEIKMTNQNTEGSEAIPFLKEIISTTPSTPSKKCIQ